MGKATKKAVILAAGKGTRMKSDLPKVLFPVCGKPIVERVLEALEAAGVEEFVVVVGYRGDLVRETIKPRPGLRFAEQKELLGTGHAVMSCREELEGFDGPVFVIAGDSPMLQGDTVARLFDEYEKSGGASCVMGTVIKENPFGMGRILRDEKGDFIGIVEEKDATDEQRKITEINMSYYIFNTPDLLASLGSLRADNAQKEYYITDVPRVLLENGKRILALPVLKDVERLGVNTLDDLKAVEDAIQAEG